MDRIARNSPLGVTVRHNDTNLGRIARCHLAAELREAPRVRGSVLECGSGLSTLLLGAACPEGAHVWALEHDAAWSERVADRIARIGLARVTVLHAPLEDYGAYTWYTRSVTRRLPGNVDLVLCDGPPSSAPGERYGLLPEARALLRAGCVVFLDDLVRDAERRTFTRWCEELGARGVVEGCARPYGRLVIPGEPPGTRG